MKSTREGKATRSVRPRTWAVYLKKIDPIELFMLFAGIPDIIHRTLPVKPAATALTFNHAY
jgi:hypothetical protein